jgi:hypothetical protein
VLEGRSPSLPMPIKMSGATAINGKKRAQTIDANCLAHGRGKFKEIFPVECGQVMEAIRRVYWYDDQTKGMSDQERLEYHQKHSGPVIQFPECRLGQMRDVWKPALSDTRITHVINRLRNSHPAPSLRQV